MNLPLFNPTNYQLSFIILIVGIILLLLFLVAETLIYLVGLLFKNIFIFNLKNIFQIIGSFLILSLAFASNNAFVYAISVIVIATLVTELEFLEKLMALIWGRKEYWEYLNKLKENQQGSVSENEKEVITQLTERINDLQKLLDETNKTKDITQLKSHFETAYSLIFGSQLTVLNMLKTYKNVPEAILIAFHRRTIWNTSYPFENYMLFLINNSFVDFHPENRTFSVTPVGEIFLEYLAKTKKPLNKPN